MSQQSNNEYIFSIGFFRRSLARRLADKFGSVQDLQVVLR